MSYYADFEVMSARWFYGRAIGWLEPGYAYPRGALEEPVFRKLVELLQNPWQPYASGRHPCSLCQFSGGPGGVSYLSTYVRIGVNNLFLPSAWGLFVAPSDILHYIDGHGYLPPEEFQAAVLNCPPMRSIDYLKGLRACGVSLRG